MEAREIALFANRMPAPTLDLSFLSAPLDPSVTFTRASIGTYFDVTGTLQTAASGVARFDYDPVAHTPRGLLIEEQRVNNVLYSVIDTSANWPVQNLTQTANATAAPDGTNTATLFTDTASTTQHSVQTLGTYAYTSGTTYVFSVFAKQGTQHGLQIFTGSGAFSSPPYANFDLAAGVAGTVTGGTSFIQNCGNGWYRCSLIAQATITGSTVPMALALTNNNNSAARAPNYSGSLTGIYVWGAQMEVGTFPTSYIPTTGATVTRAADNASSPLPGNWFTVGNGSLAFEYSYSYQGVNNQFIYSIEDPTGQIAMYENGGGPNVAVLNKVANSAVWNANVGPVAVGAIGKVAVAWAASGLTTQVGATKNTNVNAASPATWTNLWLGKQNSGSQLDGYVRRARYWPQALTALQLQQVTT